jgi:hypothetical protein
MAASREARGLSGFKPIANRFVFALCIGLGYKAR